MPSPASSSPGPQPAPLDTKILRDISITVPLPENQSSDTETPASDSAGDRTAATSSSSALDPNATTPPGGQGGASLRRTASTRPGASDYAPLSPGAADRVYPIRSVVNIEPHRAISPASSAGLSGLPGDEFFAKTASHSGGSVRGSGSSVNGGEHYQPLSSHSTQPPASLMSSRQNSTAGFPDLPPATELPMYYTKRHEHVETKEGHMVITGVMGTDRMQRCEDEPIHIPGAVQSFGCLVAVKESEDGSSLDIRMVSENTKDIIGYTPAELFERGNFCSILSDEQTDNLFDHIDFVRDDTDITVDGPEVFSLVVTGPDSVNIRLWCALHIPEGNPDLFICEFELEEDHRYPLIHPEEFPQDQEPEDTLSSNPTDAEFAQSTTSMSRPLRVLRHARRRRGEAAAMEVFNLMSQVQEQLASAANLDDLLRVVCGLVKELSGFHRVMIYQFDEIWNGKVVAELVDPRATKDLYMGLNFPASDIPAQARELYKVNKVRLLYDRDQQTARLVCKSEEDLQIPLDLKHSCLRAMSPIHIKYLKNMSVRASMSISIKAFGQLWGLISCHSYGQRGMRVSFPIRKMCRLIGETASRNIERLNYARRLHARKLINTVPTEQNPGGYIVASSDDLLRLFDADCGLLSIRDETKVLGKLEDSQEALAMLEYLRMRNFTSVITSEDLSKDFPDLRYEPGFQTIAGLLLVPLSMGCDDFIVFLRKPELKNVQWAGNPYEKVLREGTHAYLEPRKSFKLWIETVKGKSRAWTEEQIETAAVLCLVYGKFIEVWRQKEAALKSSQLTKLLLANASHEVRTPLNAIINYLEIALEGPLDRETRDNLARSHSASKSLIYVINDLLDLTRTEGGNLVLQDEVFELPQCIRDATEMFKIDSHRKGIDFKIHMYPGVPNRVVGDPARLRQIVSNIAGNAVKHTTEGEIKVEVWVSSREEDECHVEIAVQDTGEGMAPTKLDALFREFEQCYTEDEEEMEMADMSIGEYPGQKILGLGLAVVARTIRNMNGQLRLKSEQGKGSRFTISIPLKVSPDTEQEATPHRRESLGEQVMTPTTEEKEITLIARNLMHRRSSDTVRRTSSAGSNHSVQSMASARSSQSAIDRMVQDLASPVRSGSPVRERRGSVSPGSNTFSGANVSQNASPPSPRASSELVRDPSLPAQYQTMAVPSGAAVPRPPSAQPMPLKLAVAGKDKFSVLVAEDDPINSKIIKKRLEKMGHDVKLTVNGKECFETFGENVDKRYDVVLMDMQMPIMDGGTSATQIRQQEQKEEKNNRIPIFAVSASLLEEERAEYTRLGFDGWILKPVDFGRLALLLEGIRDANVRKAAEYVPGNWEAGGWFFASEEDRTRRRQA